MKKSQTRAKRKYDKEHYYHPHILLPKEMEPELKRASEISGKSINAYVVEAINEKMNGDA